MLIDQRNDLEASAILSASPLTFSNHPSLAFDPGKITIEKIHTLFWQNWLQFQPYLYRCCLKWLNYNPDLSQELLHQGMLKAYQKFSHYFEQIYCIKAWLRQLLFHLYLDQYRKTRSSLFFTELLEDTLTDNWCLSPLSAVLKQELEDKFQQSVALLPLTLYRAFCLRFYEEQSYEEIARSQSISVCNARKRVQLARTKLKQELKAYLCNET
ncbi:MAG: RNA polymerase sigma factor [Microcystaceae cyanobacterium]